MGSRFMFKSLRISLVLLTLASIAVATGAWESRRLMEVHLSPEELTDLGPAPELHAGQWLNQDIPLKLADLRGQVVLLEMWTFGCINCQRVTPYIRSWHENYQADGLVVIGNHYPEFEWEADVGNVKQALVDQNITYPVLIDNERVTWRAYNNRYWPTIYLIDKWGQIRYVHIGEGSYEFTEAAIQTLLAEEYP